ncbi:ribosomal protein L21-like protein [Podospora didyma]|uniref:Large ribosomal subunit protein bL21m n=1 Tax=Podospora didyma TaxID=330526 RepID=A0AAE0K9H6_9PEZI|nr:ribosomal protein L21-like protein [Podospora didyma]
MSRALLRSALELRTPITRLPPPFLLPMRTAAAAVAASPAQARFFNQTTQITEPSPIDHHVASSKLDLDRFGNPKSKQPTHTAQPNGSTPRPSTSGPLTESVRTLLPLLAAQPGHYVTIHIHGRPYLVTEGDSVRLPFKMPGVAPGDVLRLNRAVAVGSRDYTLKGAPYVDERLFACRAVVLGTEAEPMRIMIKKKPRIRRARQVKSKLRFTMLRISEIKISDVDEVERAGEAGAGN